MYIVFEYEVVTDELLCEITKALGVFNDFWSARQFFHLEADRRALNTQMSLLEKKKGDTGLFLFEKGRGSCLLIDLKMIEEKHQEALRDFEEIPKVPLCEQSESFYKSMKELEEKEYDYKPNVTRKKRGWNVD